MLRGKGPLKILWIHGWGMSPDIWRKEIAAWLGDARPFDDSTQMEQEPYWAHYFFSYAHCRTADSFQEVLGQTIEALKPDAVVGWSMGGMLALEWLSQEEQEDWPGKVAIVGSTLCFVATDRKTGWPRRIVERMHERINTEPSAVLQQFAQSMLSQKEQTQGTADERLKKPVSDFTRDGLAAGLEYLIHTDLRDEWRRKLAPSLAERRLKLLWIHGGADPICPTGAMPVHSKGFESVEVAGAGHVPFITQPNAFFGRLRGFLIDDTDR